MLLQSEANRLKGKNQEALETNTKIEKLLLEAYSTFDTLMKHLTGLELLEILQYSPLTIILTTAYSEFTLEGYKLNIVDYLLKPHTFQHFVQATDSHQLLYYKTHNISDLQVCISSRRFVQRIPWEDILFESLYKIM